MFNVSPLNEARTGWSFHQSVAWGCALPEVEVHLDGDQPFEEP